MPARSAARRVFPRTSGSVPRGVLAAVVVLATPLPAQEVTAPVTLSVWADEVWLSLLDRDGSYFGRLAEEGTFQRFNPRMDHEYGLDARTGLFTLAEDARWMRVGNGFRAAGTSISHPHILHRIDWRQSIPVAGSVDVLARYRRERSLTARRDHPRIGVRWNEALGSPWSVEAHLGVHFFKPSADLEVAVSRSWGSRESWEPREERGDGEEREEREKREEREGRREAGGALWEVETRVAALDAFNDVIFEALGVGDPEVEAHLRYGAAPLAARLSARRVSPRWLVELHGGASTRSAVEVTFPTTDEPPFAQRERVVFAGGLVQARPARRLAVALFGTMARADTDRRVEGADSGSFVLRERTATAGVRPRFQVSGTTTLEADLGWVWRPEERRAEGRPAVDHSDREIFGRAAAVRRPAAEDGGWTGRVAYAVLDRDAGVLAPGLTARNARLVIQAGYRFASGFEVTAGTGWDLDAFGRAPFDGGHLRIAGAW